MEVKMVGAITLNGGMKMPLKKGVTVKSVKEGLIVW